MKLASTLLAAATLCGSCFAAFSQDSDNFLHWYYLEIEKGNAVAGTSDLSPDRFAKALGTADFVRLDSVRSHDGAGHWKISSLPFTAILFVRSQLVRTFIPMTEAPKDFEPKGAK